MHVRRTGWARGGADPARGATRTARRLALLGAALTLSCAKPPPLTEPGDARFAAVAPDSFDVEMITTKGPFVVRVHRDWAPNGADRFHALVQGRYYNGLAFFRVIRGFVAQFGIHGDTAVSAAWRTRTIPDDPPRASNTRGTLSYARLGPDTRATQLFINLNENVQLDRMDGIGFPPIGRVTSGMPVLDALEAMYSGPAGREIPGGPDQDSIRIQGDAYLRRKFPQLDRIESARVLRSWR